LWRCLRRGALEISFIDVTYPTLNVDNSGHLIPDPRTADRGPYTNFCTFMVVKHGHIKIN